MNQKNNNKVAMEREDVVVSSESEPLVTILPTQYIIDNTST